MLCSKAWTRSMTAWKAPCWRALCTRFTQTLKSSTVQVGELGCNCFGNACTVMLANLSKLDVPCFAHFWVRFWLRMASTYIAHNILQKNIRLQYTCTSYANLRQHHKLQKLDFWSGCTCPWLQATIHATCIFLATWDYLCRTTSADSNCWMTSLLPDNSWQAWAVFARTYDVGHVLWL